MCHKKTDPSLCVTSFMKTLVEKSFRVKFFLSRKEKSKIIYFCDLLKHRARFLAFSSLEFIKTANQATNSLSFSWLFL